ncbi:MAG: hypothetical protein WAZ77_11195 [Candidatus Nitrosopolaris sp.]
MIFESNRIQLINAESFDDKMKKNVGEKRNEITIQQIEEQQFESNTKYKITSSTLVMA